MERKTIKFECKEVNEDEGTFTGYASTFVDVPDSYGDVVDKGAFKKTIKENRSRIKMLWNHNFMEPIGKPLEMAEDDQGLLIKGKLTLGVQRAREILALMKDGVINEMSIGYDTITDVVVKGVRHLKEVRLWDVSPVTFAANQTAIILDVKAMEEALHSEDISAVKDVVTKLQALLEQFEGTMEPELATPDPEIDQEAADMEGVVATLKAENERFDEQKAIKSIESILERMKITSKEKANA